MTRCQTLRFLGGSQVQWKVPKSTNGTVQHTGPFNPTSDKNVRAVIFPCSFGDRFTEPPHVMVSATWVDVSNGFNTRYKIAAIDVDAKGFNIRAETWNNTRFFAIEVSWVAVGY